MAILTREQILSADDLAREVVAVPEWGGEVVVIGMTGTQRDAFESGMIQQRGKSQSVNLANIRAKLCGLSICGDDGKRLFSDGDISALGAKSAAALQRVFEVAQRLSGLNDDAVEELSKGLEESPLDGSPSA